MTLKPLVFPSDFLLFLNMLLRVPTSRCRFGGTGEYDVIMTSALLRSPFCSPLRPPCDPQGEPTDP